MDLWQNYPYMFDMTVQEGPEQILAEGTLIFVRIVGTPHPISSNVYSI